jgi:formylglycine-generating enzyme required for sulfatase activity
LLSAIDAALEVRIQDRPQSVAAWREMTEAQELEPTAPNEVPAPHTEEAGGATQQFLGKTLKPVISFQDCLDCPEMVAALSGEFMVGSLARELGHDDNKISLHRVMIPAAFDVGTYTDDLRRVGCMCFGWWVQPQA